MEPKATDCLEMVPQVEKDSPYGTKKKIRPYYFPMRVAQDKFS